MYIKIVFVFLSTAVIAAVLLSAGLSLLALFGLAPVPPWMRTSVKQGAAAAHAAEIDHALPLTGSVFLVADDQRKLINEFNIVMPSANHITIPLAISGVSGALMPQDGKAGSGKVSRGGTGYLFSPSFSQSQADNWAHAV